MMKCAGFEQLIDSHLDDELSGSLRLEFDAHRLRCRHCQLTLAMMESIEHVVISDRPTLALSDDFTARVMVDVEQRRPLSVRLRPTRLAVVAGVLLQAAAVLYLAVIWPSSEPAAPPSSTELPSDAELAAKYEESDRTTERKLAYTELIYARLQAAGMNVTEEFDRLAKYPLEFKFPPDLAQASVGMEETNPWHSILGALLPVDSEEPKPAPSTGDQYSL